MDNSLKCEVVRDLFPSYIDGLTSTVTNEEIQKHVSDCQECSLLLKELQRPEEPNKFVAAELNYLKKVRYRTRIKIAVSVLAAVIMVMSIFTWRVFIYGFSASPSSISYTVSLDGNTVKLNGTLLGSGDGYSHVKFSEENGVVTAQVFAAPVLLGHTDHFSETYTAKEPVKSVYLDHLIAYENGEISKKVAELYLTKTPYVGDIVADNRVAAALGIKETIGAYSNELHTSTKPYGWTLCLSDILSSSEKNTLRDKMTAYSYVMISLIDNLGYVSWVYQTDSGSETLTVTEKEASQLLGKDIKSCSARAIELQNLLHSLGID